MMHYSPESLHAFVEAAALGSFSAAARKLHKSQSTISTAINNLETDLGLTLFDRQARQPTLTAVGRKVLSYVQEILAASERLAILSTHLANHIEPRLTLAFTDSYQPNNSELLMQQFEQRYQDIELEYFIAEDNDVIDLLQTGRAHLGILAAQANYPADISVIRLSKQTRMRVYVASQHALAHIDSLTAVHLTQYRQLYLNTYCDNPEKPQGRFWSAPSYLMLLAMAQQGFGWAILPDWLVEQYGQKQLTALTLAGWPRFISLDLVWSKKNIPGPAGLWLLNKLQEC